MELLDEWSPNLPEELKDKFLKENFRRIGTAIQFMGADLLVDQHSRLAQSVTATSYTPLTAFNGSFQSSGGLIVIVASFAVAANAGLAGYIQMVIDGQEKSVAYMGLSTQDIPCAMFWAGNVLSGKHTIAFNAKVSGNTLTVGTTSGDSGFYVFEFRKG